MGWSRYQRWGGGGSRDGVVLGNGSLGLRAHCRRNAAAGNKDEKGEAGDRVQGWESIAAWAAPSRSSSRVSAQALIPSIALAPLRARHRHSRQWRPPQGRLAWPHPRHVGRCHPRPCCPAQAHHQGDPPLHPFAPIASELLRDSMHDPFRSCSSLLLMRWSYERGWFSWNLKSVEPV